MNYRDNDWFHPVFLNRTLTCWSPTFAVQNEIWRTLNGEGAGFEVWHHITYLEVSGKWTLLLDNSGFRIGHLTGGVGDGPQPATVLKDLVPLLLPFTGLWVEHILRVRQKRERRQTFQLNDCFKTLYINTVTITNIMKMNGQLIWQKEIVTFIIQRYYCKNKNSCKLQKWPDSWTEHVSCDSIILMNEFSSLTKFANMFLDLEYSL